MRLCIVIALCFGVLGCDVALGLGDFHRQAGDGGAQAEGGDGGTNGDGGDSFGGAGGTMVPDAWSPSSTADISLDHIAVAPGKVVIAGTFAGAVDFGNDKSLDAPADGNADFYVALFDDALNCERAYAIAVSEARGEDLRGVGWLNTGELMLAADVPAGTSIPIEGDVATAVDANWMLANIDTQGTVDLFVMDALGDQFLAGMEVRTDDVVIAGHFQGLQQLPGCGDLMASGADDVFVAIMYPWLNCFAAVRWGTQGGLDHLTALAVNDAGDIALAGFFVANNFDIGSATLSSDGDGDAFVAKLEDDLDPIWAHTLGATGTLDVHDIALTQLGDVVASGTYPAAVATQDGCTLPIGLPGAVGSDADGFVLRLDATTGCHVAARAMPLDGPTVDFRIRVAPLPDDGIYVAGFTRGTLMIAGATYGVSNMFSFFEARLDDTLVSSAPILHAADMALRTDLVADDSGHTLFAGTYQHGLTWADGTAESSDTVSAFLVKNATN